MSLLPPVSCLPSPRSSKIKVKTQKRGGAKRATNFNQRSMLHLHPNLTRIFEALTSKTIAKFQKDLGHTSDCILERVTQGGLWLVASTPLFRAFEVETLDLDHLSSCAA